MAPPLRIGLTGGIGSGKSTVATLLARHGAEVIDTDAIARRLCAANGAAIPALRAAFGDAIVGSDGAMDRDAMRTLAFSDPAAKARLEAVLHPMISAEVEREAAAAANCGTLVFDVPLLAESLHWRARVDRILVIDCDPETQIARIVRRPGWTRDAAQSVIAGQASRAARRAMADAVIVNDSIDLAALEAAVGRVWRQWQALAQNAVEQ